MDKNRVVRYVVFFMIFAQKKQAGKSDIIALYRARTIFTGWMYENHFVLRLCVLRYSRINRIYLFILILCSIQALFAILLSRQSVPILFSDIH